MIPPGGVYSLCSGEGREEWERGIIPNVRHIVRGVVRGTAYLHENMSIQHVDLKGIYVHHLDLYTVHLCISRVPILPRAALSDPWEVNQTNRGVVLRLLAVLSKQLLLIKLLFIGSTYVYKWNHKAVRTTEQTNSPKSTAPEIARLIKEEEDQWWHETREIAYERILPWRTDGHVSSIWAHV